MLDMDYLLKKSPKKSILFHYSFLGVMLTLFCNQTGYAIPNKQFFPMAPRLVGEVGASTHLKLINADVMAPIYVGANRIWFLNGIGSYGSNSSRLGSVGIGLRNIFQNTWLAGGYVFSDWNKTQNGADFWVINPGVEFMDRLWDVHINGYFPATEKQFLNAGTASRLGSKNYLFFHQHGQFDKILNLYDVIGKGGDIEIGYSIPLKENQTRIFAGGYFYTPQKVSNISGIQAGIQFPITQHIKAVLQDSYDNVFHNTAALTVQFTLGGIQQTEAHRIEEHMLDPIPRHLGTLNTGSGVLNQQQKQNTGKSVLVDNNLWFFQPGTGSVGQTVTPASCTFEHPCVGLSQTTINGINNISPNAKLFLAPGQYNNALVGNGFTLNTGQSIFGRTQNYMQLARGSHRALVNDTLFLNGNNIVNNIQVIGQSDAVTLNAANATRAGIAILDSAVGTVKINYSNINTTTTDTNHDAVGVLNSSLNAITSLNKSTVIALTSGADGNGIGLMNRGTMKVNSSTLSGTTIGIPNVGSVGTAVLNKGVLTIANSTLSGNAAVKNTIGMGIFNEDFGDVHVLNSTITTNSPTAAEGIFNEDFGKIRFEKSTIKAHSDTFAVGIFNQDFGFIKIINSTITATSPTLSRGIFNQDFAAIHILNSTIFANKATDAAAIFNQDFGAIVITNSTITANSPTLSQAISNQDVGSMNISNSIISARGAGITTPIANTATVTQSGFNLCFAKGVLVPCLAPS